MSTDDEAQRDPGARPDGESGLFSQLPKTRPGTRSPRRGGVAASSKQQAAGTKGNQATPAAFRAADAAERAREEAGVDPVEPPAPRQAPPRAEEEAPSRPDRAPEEDRSLGPAGLEDLAWAGVAVTAEAATLGIRLLGRAVEAARRATDRS